ncbi:MAG: hypothetical protein HQK74_11570 [Desulfamplus sp.]|nr:hypothetical protein [Desulfamplus sp.]
MTESISSYSPDTLNDTPTSVFQEIIQLPCKDSGLLRHDDHYIEREQTKSFKFYKIKRKGNELWSQSIAYTPKSLFDEFLSQEIGKLKELAVMFCESEQSSATMFGYSLIDMLERFDERIEQAAFHVNRAIGGEIKIMDTGYWTKSLNVGTVIDAEIIKEEAKP